MWGIFHRDSEQQKQQEMEQLLAQEQFRIINYIVDALFELKEKNLPQSLREKQLIQLKMKFDQIKPDAIRSEEGHAVYEQLQEYFRDNLPVETYIRGLFEQFDKKDPAVIVSHGENNVSQSNYHNSTWNMRGLMYCSGYNGAMHLFLPDRASNGITSREVLSELKTAKYVIASVCDNGNSPLYLELLFEDNTESPYMLHLSYSQVDPSLFAEDNAPNKMELQIHAGPASETVKIFQMWVRHVGHLPYMKPWGK